MAMLTMVVVKMVVVVAVHHKSGHRLAQSRRCDTLEYQEHQFVWNVEQYCGLFAASQCEHGLYDLLHF
jgi:hypothetical protein